MSDEDWDTNTYRDIFEIAIFAVYSIEKASKVADSLLVNGLTGKVRLEAKIVVPTHPAAACRAVIKNGNGN